jgi:hypothetical protein
MVVAGIGVVSNTFPAARRAAARWSERIFGTTVSPTSWLIWTMAVIRVDVADRGCAVPERRVLRRRAVGGDDGVAARA